MKTIGIIGGVSWASSSVYYRRLNELMRDRFGSLHSADILMYSIPFNEFARQERLAASGDWLPLLDTMLDAARRLKNGGADFVVTASNTLNSLNMMIEDLVDIKVVSIIEAVGQEICRQGLKKVALLGTKHTMSDLFYAKYLEKFFQLQAVSPNAEEVNMINTVIFDELCNDLIVEKSKQQYLEVIDRMVKEEKVEGVILGCTEIPLLINQADLSIPAFDSTEIHVHAALDYALREE